jgi:hypothetical protein
MEKEAFNERTPQHSDNEFVDLDSPMFNPFDQLELLSLLGHEMVTECNTGSGVKDSREELKTTHGRASYPTVPHFNIQTHAELSKNSNDKLKLEHDSVKRESKPKHEEQKSTNHSCSICNKTYKKKDNLVSHMRKHVLSLY